MFTYKKLTNKEHLLYHFKSYLEEFKRCGSNIKSYHLIVDNNQVLIELLSDALDIPYSILLNYLYGGHKNAKTDEE